MSSVCVSCGRPADQFRDVVRVVNMRVEITCRTCAAAGAGAAPAGPFAAPSPPQSQPYPHPHPHAHGHGTGAHAALPPTGMPAPVLTPPAPPPTPRPPSKAAVPSPRPLVPATPVSRRNEIIGLAVVLLVAVGSLVALVAHSRGDSPGNASVSGQKKHGKKIGKKVQPAVSPEEGADFDVDAPPPEGLAAIMTGEWTHPLAGPYRELPGNDVQRFGAYRARDEFFKRYCGSGHCGVDLGNDLLIGLPVIACRDGVIEKIAHQPALEGKFLRIRHAGTVRTYYMHLDQVAPELVLGGTVKAGQMIGTLGKTGIKNSAAHLHFMITFESKTKEMYIDPEPILQEAKLVEVETIPEWAKRSDK